MVRFNINKTSQGEDEWEHVLRLLKDCQKIKLGSAVHGIFTKIVFSKLLCYDT